MSSIADTLQECILVTATRIAELKAVVGQGITTRLKKVTRGDVRQFALLTGDENPIHLVPEAGRNSLFGECVAHGMLVASVAMGIAWQEGFLRSFDLILKEVSSMKWTRPVFFEDDIYLTIELVGLREMQTAALAVFEVSVFNRAGEEVLTAEWKLFVKERPLAA